MIRLLFSLLFLLSFFPTSLTFAQTSQVSMATYYPAPFGAYDRMRLVPRADLAGSCDNGTVYYRSSSDSLRLCAGNVWTDFAGGYWNKNIILNAVNPNYDPYSSADIDTYNLIGDYSDLNVRKPYIGIGTDTPRNTLHLLVDSTGTPSSFVIENKYYRAGPYAEGSPGPGANISFRGTTASETYQEFVGLRAVFEDVSDNRVGHLRLYLADGTSTINEKVRFTGTGRVGILDDGPDGTLEIVKGAGATPYLLVSTTKNDPDNGNVFNILSDGKVGINRIPTTDLFEVGGDSRIYGNLKAVTLVLTSDADLKKDIKPVTNALDKVARIKGVSYEWKNDSMDDRTHLGVLAQDVEKVFPEAVYGKDGDKGVDYPALIAPLIEAVKELKSQNESLLKEIQSQATQIQEQQDQINTLKDSLYAE